MNIQPITEAAHNQAVLTLVAERQELLFYREKVPQLEEHIKGLKEQIETQAQKITVMSGEPEQSGM